MADPTAGETEDERQERQLSELLQETRIAMPGVQILFAFLLAVPFQQRFTETTAFQRDVYVITMLLAASATICLIAPAAYHRVRFHQRDRPHLIRVGNAFLLAGLACLAGSIVSAVLLVTDLVFKDTTMIVLAGSIAVAVSWLWFGYPIARHLRTSRSH